MASNAEQAASTSSKSQKPPRIVPVVPHALAPKNRQEAGRPKPGNNVQLKENRAPAPTKADDLSTQSSGKDLAGNNENALVDPMANGLEEEHVVEAASTSPETTVSHAPARTSPSTSNLANEVSASAVENMLEETGRPLPQELPPPFYPSHQRSNPTSVASVPSQQDLALSGVPSAPVKTVANNLVFGGFRESANPSPVPPPAQPPQPQPPVQQWQGQGPPPAITGSHSYHMSEPHAMPTYIPPFVHNSGGFAYQRDQQYHGQSPFGQPRTFYPQNPRHQRKQDEHNSYQRFAPTAPRMHPNAPPIQHMRPPFDGGPGQFRPPYQQGPPASGLSGPNPPQYPTPNVDFSYRGNTSDMKPQINPTLYPGETQVKPQGFEDSSNLLPYIRSQFGNRDFADYAMQFSHSSYAFPPVSLPTHAIIMSRCPKLRSLMAMQQGNPSERQSYPKMLNVPISDRFLNSDAALMKAVARLYGDSLLDQASLLAMSSSPPESNPVEQMRLALAYAAAGHFLEIDEIISCGLDVAGAFLTLENIGQALAFSLEGGLSSSFAGSEGGSEDRTSTTSLDDAPTKLDSPPSAPTYGFYSDRLLNRIIGFTVQRWPQDFELSSAAPQIQEAPRLPAVGEPPRRRSESRFSHIRFGEMTMDDQGTADPMTTKLSSVLVSLPFPVLKRVLENPGLGARVGWPKMAAVTRAVVAEREARRQRAIANKDSSGAPDSAVEERLWYTARWSESLEPDTQHPLGARLVRYFVGMGTPTSSESAKE